MAENLLSIKDLNVVYKTGKTFVYAVNGISFDIDEKETLGLVGETGAGKTTTALSILRLLPERTGKITSGDIVFEGESILAKDKDEMLKIRGKGISMIFQDPMTSLNPVHRVGTQIGEVLRLHNTEKYSNDEIEKRVEEMLELVGIPAKRKTDYPFQFSGGMKQRVVIAIALAANPRLLIADEPTTALDVTVQAQVLRLMKGLKEKFNTSMIMITHDLGIVAQTCDKVAIMYAGQVIEFGTVEDIFNNEKHHPYTVGLFGSLPNMEDESDRLKPIQGLMPDPTNLPTGCKFHPRCTKCMEMCKTVAPIDYVDGQHRILCHLYTGSTQA